MQTPDISHLTAADYDRVYEPAEDSFLLLDALEADLERLRARRPRLALEVGSGSGVVITALAAALPECLCLATDLSEAACRATWRTAHRNGVTVLPVRCDLTAALRPRLAGQLDVVLFNPPYVVTSTEEVCASGGLAASWAGGERGREVTDRLLPQLPELLAPDGLFYLVAIRENDVDDLGAVMAGLGFDMCRVMSRRAGPEHLSVLRFERRAESGGTGPPEGGDVPHSQRP
ncbi:methyltransferase N6AMT1-like [Amphibalanus amphitrite]|uniref:methyltransferase N6AMT1-like n=1 Tax=Amphibalanus amphitrite TaxID=1232801 RepID=UPI001C92A497|nr:methyltransferase N6AMT1-like [Amphibalanus amphitrite]XP_043204079.1 methyltransferase N6AMT1-like [Amphibalanus amphitrite]